MKKMTMYQRKELSEMLNAKNFTHAISISQIDATCGSIWILHTEGVERLTAKDPKIQFFFAVASSQPWSVHGAGIHGHGVLRTSLTHRQIQSCFKGCNKPVIRDIYDGPGWIEYVLYKNDIIEETEIHNIQMEMAQ